jgi:hypothetical protein
MAVTVDTDLAASAHYANVFGMLGNLGRQSIAGPGVSSWAKVMLLVHGDGANGAVSAPDSSQYARTPTITGGVTVTDAGTHIGTGSLTNATTPSNVIYPSSADFELPAEYTLEFTVTPLEAVAGYLLSHSAVSYWICNVDGGIQNNGWGFTNTIAVGIGNTARIAICRNAANVVRVFKDGVLQFKQTLSSSQPASAFGLFGVPGRPDLPSFRGRLEEVRYTKGLCRYDSDATYTVSPDPFPHDS